MNTVKERFESRIAVNRARPLRGGPIFVEHPDPVASQSVEVQLSRSVTSIPSRRGTKWVQRFTRNANDSRFVTVPLASIAFMTLVAGLIMIGWGVAVKSGRLAVEGFLLTLVGCSFYGCRLFDH